MKRTLRIGTRGSALALRQTQSVCALLKQIDPSLHSELAIIATDGDLHPNMAIDEDWPKGGFVGAIERSLLEGNIDLAVHSHKDLPSEPTPGLVVAAAPARERANDVLLTGERVEIDDLPRGLRIGTSSARRAAQMRRAGDVEIVAIRGNVPTRIAQIGRTVDGVVLAAAGLRRLGIQHPYCIELPLDRFVPAPAQGALAIQAREDDRTHLDLVRAINDDATWLAVRAERAMLRAIGAGCRTPVGALARLESDRIALHGQLFSADGQIMVEKVQRGVDPQALGESLAVDLMKRLRAIMEVDR